MASLSILEHLKPKIVFLGEECSEYKARDEGSVIWHAPDLTDLNLVKGIKKGEKQRQEREEKMTVTQGGTQTHDLANGLPCSNQLSYRVTCQLSGWIRMLQAELPEIQPKRIPSMFDGGGGAATAKRGLSYLLFNILQTWQSDLNLSAPEDTASRRTHESCPLNMAPQISSYLVRCIGSGHVTQSSLLVLTPNMTKTDVGELWIDHGWSKYKPCSQAEQILSEHLVSMVLCYFGSQVTSVEVNTDLLACWLYKKWGI